MQAHPGRIFEFGSFRLIESERQLLKEGQPVSLTPKVFDTLLVLVENGGRLVDKHELMSRLWPDSFVEEINLNRSISTLRKALGETAGSPVYIETVPKSGYRFVASVVEVETDSADLILEKHTSAEIITEEEEEITDSSNSEREGWSARGATRLSASPGTAIISRLRGHALPVSVILLSALLGAVGYLWASGRPGRAAPTAEVKSIAVLPFQNLGASSDDELLGVGMADALITKLSALRQWSVRPTSAVLRLDRERQDSLAVGRMLGVDAVLEGSIHRSEGRIRVTARLLRVSDQWPLWAATMDESSASILVVEDKVSRVVAEVLLPALSGSQQERLNKRYTYDTAAYQSYVQGRYYWSKRTPEAIHKAIGYFEDAIARDSHYALAYSGLADSYALLGRFEVPTRDLIARARSAATKALEIDEELAEAHSSLGFIKHRFDWDWAGAEKELKRAIELDPGYATAHQWYGWYLISLGSFDQALEEFRRAQHLDPLSLYINLALGMPYYYSRQYDKAIEEYKRVLEMDAGFPLVHRWLGFGYVQQGKYDEAIAELKEYSRLVGANELQSPWLGYCYAVSGREKDGRRVLKELKRLSGGEYASASLLAIVYLGFGDTDQAYYWLDRAADERSQDFIFLKVDPAFDGLRSDSRYAVLLKRVGVPD
jgi:DNA-binding winged helix-turn-helix (wHTH) protein/TolB-like protein/Tfp pilus assembly protein PilF